MMAALGPHAGYIVGAIGFSILCLVVLAGQILWRYRGLKAQLKALEEKGLTRRSGTGI